MPESLVVARARLVAHGLLFPLGDRWAHVGGVAHAAVALSDAVDDDDDRALLVASAWLHDVGYAPALRLTGSHQIDGATHLLDRGFSDRLCALVAHHSGAAIEVSERGLSDELVRWQREESPVADALWTADMTTGPRGERVSYSQRLEEILRRYDPGSAVARAMQAAEPSIRAAINRTTQRMARGQSI